MIRDFQPADFLTLANGASGTTAIFLAMEHVRAPRPGNVYAAAVLVMAALVFDFLDGRIARRRHASSPLGRELDSLADVISFGVAPASLAYAVGMSGGLDVIALLYFVACGISRLARYNVTAAQLTGGGGKVTHFEGTPIPTSLVLVLVLWIAAWQGAIGDNLWFGVMTIAGFKFHPLVLLFAISGSLMVSRIKIPKL